ncbi:MAG: hypothetical protein M1355_01985 [Patescibacteria group bacterium]|nr:hypothetical protein [Patescibacteria group bacterium]
MNRRDDAYLQGRLDMIWDRYFSDIEQKNDVKIKFGRRARTRLGSIRQESREHLNSFKPTTIIINGLLKDEKIPEFLIDSVIAHEMVHYTHGFASPHERKYATPHAGGVIKKEMQRRGLEDLFVLQKKWLKENWQKYAAENLPKRSIMYRKPRRRRFSIIFR